MNQRGEEYGHLKENFDRISALASIMLGRTITPYEIAVMLLAVKMSRMSENRFKLDNYFDGVNYMAFAGCFAAMEATVYEHVREP
jgi:hypothetical protein